MPFTRAKLRAAKKNTQRRFHMIAREHSAGKHKAAYSHTLKYLDSYEAKLAAVAAAAREIPIFVRPRFRDIPKIAERLNPGAGTKEKARVLLIPKGNNGDFRRVVDFGIENRSLQYLIIPLIEASCHLHPLQFGSKGVGEAIDTVCELMKEGHLWTVETDIKDCFPSFEGENLHKILRLPKEVISYVIMGENLNMVPGDRLLNVYGPAVGDEGNPVALACELAEARRGIPHGSAPASRIAEVLIAPALQSLSKEAIVLSYADNMLTMARSEADAVSVTEALWVALDAQPVGHLKPYMRATSKPGEPIRFLGHSLNLKNGNILIEPSPENEFEFNTNVQRRFNRLAKPASTAVRKLRAVDLREYIISWTASFSRCVGIQARRDYWLSKIGAAMNFN